MTNLVIWLCAMWLSCAPAQSGSGGGGTLEQMEAEIAKIVELARPAVVGVSVKRSQGWYRMGSGGALSGSEPMVFSQSFGSAAEAPEAPEPPEPAIADENDDEYAPNDMGQDEARERAEELREEAHKLKRARAETEKIATALEKHNRNVFLPSLAVNLGGAGRSIGSGVLLEGGYALTTHTVAGNGEEVTVSLADGKELKGKLVGSDDATDLALIKLEEANLPGVKLGDSGKTRVGSIGIFLSRSYGKLDNVNFGFITGREDTGGGEMLRLNFPIGPGESGSPLLNTRGEIVGIASANLRRSIQAIPFASGENLWTTTVEAPVAWGGENSREFSYFIPADRIKAVLEDLKQYGEVRRAWFGVSGTDTTIKVSATEKQRGVLVEEVIDESSAQKAGIQVGDILLRCNGQPTPNFVSLRAIIEKLAVGKTVKVTVRRSGKEIELDVTPQARPGAAKLAKAGSGDLGMILVPKSKELASYLNLADSPDGKVVSSIANGSLAERAGIRKGDLLLDDPKPGKTVRVWRDGKTIELEIPAK